MKIRRKGFTIVEMLMVIAVLAVLTGIVTTAAASAIRQARTRRAEAMRMVIQNGIATYRAQHGYWPPRSGDLQTWANDGLKVNAHVDYLSNEEYDKMMSFLVKECVNKTASPVMDVSGLTVATRSSANRGDGKGYGQDFRSAVAKNKKHGSTLKVNEMVFGYSTTKEGYFRRYVVKYNADSDSVTVLTQEQYYNETNRRWPDKR